MTGCQCISSGSLWLTVDHDWRHNRWVKNSCVQGLEYYKKVGKIFLLSPVDLYTLNDNFYFVFISMPPFFWNILLELFSWEKVTSLSLLPCTVCTKIKLSMHSYFVVD